MILKYNGKNIHTLQSIIRDEKEIKKVKVKRTALATPSEARFIPGINYLPDKYWDILKDQSTTKKLFLGKTWEVFFYKADAIAEINKKIKFIATEQKANLPKDEKNEKLKALQDQIAEIESKTDFNCLTFEQQREAVKECSKLELVERWQKESQKSEIKAVIYDRIAELKK